MPPSSLFRHYLAAGLIQFGHFEGPGGEISPLALNFLLLPSFPALLKATAQALTPPALASGADRLLALRSVTALGGVLAVESGLPLTYHYGEMRGISNAFIIEGAYDIGHPTALLCDVLGADTGQILAPARQVGLNIQQALALICMSQAGRATLEAQGIRVWALLDLAELLPPLAEDGTLPRPLVQTLMDWLARQ
jgi:orotate phosphoribosyltransferase